MGVTFLQETHLHDPDQWWLGKYWAGQFFHSNFKGKARASAFLIDSNIPFESPPPNIITDTFGHFIIVSDKLYNKSVVLANVYAPNADDVQFFNTFFSELPDLNSHSLSLGGDFNCYLDAVLGRSSPKSTTLSNSASYFKAFLDFSHLSHPWQFLYQTICKLTFTWTRTRSAWNLKPNLTPFPLVKLKVIYLKVKVTIMSMVEKAQLCGLRAKQENGECTDNGCITSHQKEINDKSRIFYSFT